MLFSRKSAPERAKHRRGLVRLFGFSTAVGVVCAGLSIRAARAEVVDQSIVVGRQMVGLANSDNNDVTKIVMNGQTMFVASSLTDDTVPTVLSRYQEHCKENLAQSTEVWRALAEKAAAANTDAANQGAAMAETGGTLRGGNDDEGAVLCFVRSSTSKASLPDALKSLQETGELGALGQLRYVYAKKTQKGGAHVLAAWTLEKFNMNELLPQEGRDVAGMDFDGVPRPAESTRILSAYLDGTPYGANVYQSRVSPEKTIAAYDDTLTKQGWFALDIEGDGKRRADILKGVTGRLYEKDGVVMTVISKVDGDRTTTALGLAGARERDARR